MIHSTEERKYGSLDEPLAIVGMSCTLAGGVDSPSAMWDTLVNKKINQSEKIPESRFNVDAYFQEKAFGRPAAIGSKGGFFLDTNIHAFDAEFFGYDADEAKHMDPQHFRILESVYECLESAGKTLDDVRGTNTAVYIGNFSLDQVIKSARHSYDDRHLHEVIGIDPGLLSSRVSYCYDLNGPVFTTNTGCTSSLFSLHTAAMALYSGQTKAAIVGGVNLLQGPEAYSSYSKFGIMSPDSMCHTFDARCNGYVRAEGVGALYIRRLSDAIRDNDPIRGVIRTIAVNGNGAVPNTPMFVPNANGIGKSLQLAYSQSQLDPYDTAYVETHGIGMIIGEIAEAHAIGKAMNEPRRRESPMLLGALKPNFGHQEAASGVFVLIKAALMTEAGIIPGHADFQSPHPAIDLEKLNIKPQTETIPWPRGYSTRRMGFCSYGWSGTNCHGIVENVEGLHPEYRQGHTRDGAGYDHSVMRPLLLTFSAFKDLSLKQNIAKHREVVDKYFPADLAYTLNVHRSKFTQRAFTIVSPSDSASNALSDSALQYGSAPKDKKDGKIAFEFATRQSNLQALGQELSEYFPVFASTVQRLDGILKQAGSKLQLEKSLQSSAPPEGPLLEQQTTAIQIALVDLLADWGVEPRVSLKTPNSELTAAYAAGVLSAAETILFPSVDGAVTADLPEISGSVRKALSEAGGGFAKDDWKRKPTTLEPAEKADLFDAITVQVGSGPDSSLTKLLFSIGKLYLAGHAVDLGKVNSVGKSNWKPSLLVDLPHYQWDHSAIYDAETWANREHRLNKHPYHDLLGRRVYGLSSRVMVWKNKLSFKDLPDSIPWVPKEKPLIQHGASTFLLVLYEALSQIHEQKSIDRFSIRNFQVQKALCYADDANEIELQTSLSQLPQKAGTALSHQAVIESFNNGTWTTHAEATIYVEAPEANGTPTNGANGNATATTVPLEGTRSTSATGSPHLQTAIVDAALKVLQNSKSSSTSINVEIGEVKVFQPAAQGQGELVVKSSGSSIEVADSDGNRLLRLHEVINV